MKTILFLLATTLFQALEKGYTLHLKPQEFYYSVFLRGEFYSLNQSQIIGPPKFHAPIISMAAHGSEVSSGDVVVTIASREAERQVLALRRQLAQEEARLERTQRDAIRERLNLDLQVLEKQYEIKAREQEIVFGSGEKDDRVIKNFDLQVSLLQEKIRLQQNKLKTYQELAAQSSVSREDLDKVQKDLKTYELDLQKIRTEKQISLRGRRNLEIEKLQLEKELLINDLGKINTQITDKARIYELQEQKNRLVIERRLQDIVKQEDVLKTARIRAPHDGIVVPVTDWMGDVGVGTSSWSGRSLATVTNYSKQRAKVLLPEKFIELAKTGLSVVITPQTSATARLMGKVTRVESIARPMNPRDRKSPKMHTLHVEFSQEYPVIPGGNLVAELVMASHSDVVILPRFLGEQDGQEIIVSTPEGKKRFPLKMRTFEHYIIDTGKQEIFVASPL